MEKQYIKEEARQKMLHAMAYTATEVAPLQSNGVRWQARSRVLPRESGIARRQRVAVRVGDAQTNAPANTTGFEPHRTGNALKRHPAMPSRHYSRPLFNISQRQTQTKPENRSTRQRAAVGMKWR